MQIKNLIQTVKIPLSSVAATDAEREKFGSVSPTDELVVALNLGSLLYSIFVSHNTAPLAPMAKALYNKKLTELAESMAKDTFTLPPEVKDLCQRVMVNDQMWSKVEVFPSGCVTDGPVVELSMNYKGAELFTNLIEKAVEVLSA